MLQLFHGKGSSRQHTIQPSGCRAGRDNAVLAPHSAIFAQHSYIRQVGGFCSLSVQPLGISNWRYSTPEGQVVSYCMVRQRSRCSCVLTVAIVAFSTCCQIDACTQPVSSIAEELIGWGRLHFKITGEHTGAQDATGFVPRTRSAASSS